MTKLPQYCVATASRGNSSGYLQGPELKTHSLHQLMTREMFGKPTSAANCYEDISSSTGYLKYGNMFIVQEHYPKFAFEELVLNNTIVGFRRVNI